MLNADPIWFQGHPRRQTRIRVPNTDEFGAAWQMLGMHDATRRRVLVWKVPPNDPGRAAVPDGLMRIPFLLNGDESIEDDDRVLLLVLADLMQSAAETKPRGGFAVTGGRVFSG